MRILAISGSPQAHSRNAALLTAAVAAAPPGVDVVVFDPSRRLHIRILPYETNYSHG